MVHARVELAVGIRAGAAFAEEQVGFGVGHARAVKAHKARAALIEPFAPVDERDPHTVEAQRERRE